MATGGKTDGPDFYNCGVCLEHMGDRNPRFLVCHHSYCESCLKQLLRNGRITCPNCRQITEIRNNVTELAMNFWLLQILDHDQVEKPAPKVQHICQFCNKYEAESKCETCNQILCKQCTEKHNKMKQFKGHNLMEMCEEHCEGITHICMKCIKPSCIKCMVLFHAEHEAKVKDYKTGCEEIKSSLTQQRDAVRRKLSQLQKDNAEDNAKMQETKALKKSIQAKKASFLKKAEEADQILSEIDKKYLHQNDQAKQAYNQVQIDGTQIACMIDSINSADMKTFLSKYASVKASLDERVQKIEKRAVMRYQQPPYKASTSPDAVITQREEKQKIKGQDVKANTPEGQVSAKPFISEDNASEKNQNFQADIWKCPWCDSVFAYPTFFITVFEVNRRKAHFRVCKNNTYR